MPPGFFRLPCVCSLTQRHEIRLVCFEVSDLRLLDVLNHWLLHGLFLSIERFLCPYTLDVLIDVVASLQLVSGLGHVDVNLLRTPWFWRAILGKKPLSTGQYSVRYAHPIGSLP